MSEQLNDVRLRRETERDRETERELPAGPDRKLLVVPREDGTVEELHVMDDVLVTFLDVRLVLDHGVGLPQLRRQSVDGAAVESLHCGKVDLLACNSQLEKTRRELGHLRPHQPQSDQAGLHGVRVGDVDPTDVIQRTSAHSPDQMSCSLLNLVILLVTGVQTSGKYPLRLLPPTLSSSFPPFGIFAILFLVPVHLTFLIKTLLTTIPKMSR